MTLHLLIVDPQNDFCDATQAGSPALPVAGAERDMLRLANFILKYIEQIDSITITLDSHHAYDISHPAFWQGDVAPFTMITAEDVRTGKHQPQNVDAVSRVLAYLEMLEKSAHYIHMVWPTHCEVGTWGHNLIPSIRKACNKWQEWHHQAAEFVFKGLNPWTEHYSAIRAEIPDPTDLSTQTNQHLIQRLSQADRILVAGESGSHCVRFTVEDVIKYVDAQKLILLADCMSPVADFEAEQRHFLEKMQQKGAQVISSQDFNYS